MLAPDRVRVTWTVHDIVAEYQAADLFPAPMPASSGMKNQLLEAMLTVGRCIPGAVNGFDEVPPCVLVGDQDSEMARPRRMLLPDKGLRRRTGKAGRDHAVRCLAELLHPQSK